MDIIASVNMKNVIAMLPEFDLIKGHITQEQFVDKLEQLQRMYNWSGDTIKFSVQQKMRGIVKYWWDRQCVIHGANLKSHC